MSYVIGIDGGGTKTILKIAGTGGELMGTYEGGPCNINSAGIEKVEKMLKELVHEGVTDKRLKIEDCVSICIGSAGIDRADEKEKMQDILKGIGFTGIIKITNDAQTALYGGVGKSEGVIVISGTGSICYGSNGMGVTRRAGGWGHIIGDEGSGYYIGVQALNHIMRSFDHREDETLMTTKILKHLNIDSPERLINYVYRSGAGKKEIAALAKIVNEAYLEGDKTAEKILNMSAHELHEIAKAVIDGLEFKSKQITLAMGGSVLVNNMYIIDVFTGLINNDYPAVSVVAVRNDAAWGAVLIALEQIEQKI